MSNGSGSSNDVVALPKGGGALNGIGEKFSPDLFTGTGNFSVPIALPPGRNGFHPELNLVYSTGNGGGPFGLGWNLNVPGVSRKTAKGVPRYDDATDTFILSGSEDLVPVARWSGRTRYRPRTEGVFACIDHHQDVDSDYWEVQDKSGLVSWYGTPRSAGADPAAIADPTDRNRVFAWKLTQTRDPFGNRIIYHYDHDLIHDQERHADQVYLRQIRYVDYRDGQGAEQFLVSVEFEYENLPERYPDEVPASGRVYPFSDYRAGFEIRTRRRCKRISVRTHAGQERMVRTYELTYLDERVAAGQLPETALPRNGASLLAEILVTGHDGNRTESLPPLAFGYTRFQPEGRRFLSLEGRDLPARSLANPDLALVDLFGNGLPDVLEMNGVVRYWRNLGGGRFDLPREMRDAPAGLRLADPGVQLVDADGDGRTDLLVTANGLAGCFPLSSSGEWDRRAYRPYDEAPTFDLQDPEVRMVDLDGDGVTDAIRSDSRMVCFFNDPESGWGRVRQVERRNIEIFPNVSLSDPRIRWADMNGDGLQDIVLIHDGNVEYWSSLGHGEWGPRIHMHHSPRFPHGYDSRRVLIGDVDGDGLADLAYVDQRQVTLWLNQSGNGWSDPIEIEGTPPVTDMDAVRLVDLLGTGVGGVLWSADAGAPVRAHQFFLDFTGGVKPYLLAEMDNGMGAVTRVSYRPSTHDYLEDQRRPETRWRTPLPFPVQVVAAVEVIDRVARSKITTEYRYHHGYWDGTEREFRGFGRVDQCDTEMFARYRAGGLHPDEPFAAVSPGAFSPPTETRNWFHLGPVEDAAGDWNEPDFSHEYWTGDRNVLDRPPGMAAFLRSLPRPARRDALRTLRGRILRTEVYARDGSSRHDRPYTVTESLHGVCEVVDADGASRLRCEQGSADVARGRRIYFPHRLAERVGQWERGDDPLHRFTFTEDYDDYGQPRRQTQIACPRGWRRLDDMPGAPYLATRSVTEYARPLDPQIYIVDRVSRSTTYEIRNQGGVRLPTLRNLPDGDAALDVVGQTLNRYDGEAFVGLPVGQVGRYGTQVRVEVLVLTSEILHQAYRTGAQPLRPPEMPPYLSAQPAWTADYPLAFRAHLAQMPRRAGFVFHPAEGYFAVTQQRRYDFQDGRSVQGLVRVIRDPMDHEVTIGYDAYDLLPTQVTDPIGLVTGARYDYRVLRPVETTDANGNRTNYSFSPLGLLESIGTSGKPGEGVGDTPAQPGTRFVYDFLTFARQNRPVSVRTIRRVHHASDLPERNETIETVEYSDGFGRLLQSRTQVEDLLFGDAPFGSGILPVNQADRQGTGAGFAGRLRGAANPANVVVSGWQTYDNKGRVVEKYEPFFSRGWDYTRPGQDEQGQRVCFYYDPRGRVIRTANPDGSEQRVVFGVPGRIGAPNPVDPDVFEPTPWERYTYDENDNAGRAHPGIASDQRHWNTPTSVEVDPLSRDVRTVHRNGPDSAADWYTTTTTYDIRGNVLAVMDVLGRTAVRFVNDLASNVLRFESIDGGVERTILDAAGNQVELHDGKGALVLQAYDRLDRLTRLWARDHVNGAVTFRERRIYGDDGDPNQPAAERAANRAANRLGRLHWHYDEAGRLRFEAYDFKGNLMEKVRQVISDDALLSVFPRSGVAPPANWQIEPFQLDWSPADDQGLDQYAAGLLEATEYRVSTRYDALNRVLSVRYPQDEAGARQQLRLYYNRAGAIDRVELDGRPYVAQIAYNARGQRTLIAFGNGLMTRYGYHPRTFRLARLRSEAYRVPARHSYQPSGSVLQDYAYDFDLVGNVTAIRDRVPGSGIPGTLLGADALDRLFAYDPLYRLLSATGRECAIPPNRPDWDNRFRCADPTRTRGYTESYTYDPAGNLRRLQHVHHAAQGNAVSNRDFTLAVGNNRLDRLTMAGTDYRYRYDGSGNLIQEHSERHYQWDHGGRVVAFRIQAQGAEPSVHAQYRYGADGQRVKKVVRRQGGGHVATIYVDGLFEHHRRVLAGSAQENDTLHIRDGEVRLAEVRVGNPLPGDNVPTVRYHLGDHLGSSNVVTNDAGDWVSREEYTPYGETSLGGFARKRYRFSGKERDEESGLAYHGARYYAPWLGRWTSVDPLARQGFAKPYAYVDGATMKLIDADGLQGQKPEAIAEVTGVKALETKYATAGKVTNITPKKGINTPGVDAHLIVGSGEGATNVIGDVKYSGKPGMQNVREVSSFDNAMRNSSEQLRRNIVNARRARPPEIDKATARGAYEGAKHAANVIEDVVVVGSNKGVSARLTARQVAVTRVDTFAHVAEKLETRQVQRALSGTQRGFVTLGGALTMLGVTASSLQVASGIQAIAHGERSLGTIDVAEGVSNLGMTLGAPAAVKAGLISAGGGGLAMAAAGVAAGGGLALAAETARAAVSGEPTPIDVADQFYGTHFGDVWGWVTGEYSDR